MIFIHNKNFQSIILQSYKYLEKNGKGKKIIEMGVPLSSDTPGLLNLLLRPSVEY